MGNVQNKTFIFLYPQQEIFDFEISRGSLFFKDPKKHEFEAYFLPKFERAKTEEEKEILRNEARQVKEESYRPYYSKKLNSCIHHRYRSLGFSIVYALLDDSSVSDIIKLRPTDKVIHVGMDSLTHRTKGSDGEYPYPDQDYILDQLLPLDVLRVGGFHLWDCVDKLARRAYERGIDVLVDEDLTEFFSYQLNDRDFRVKTYPTYNPKKGSGDMFEEFMEVRKDRPWFWQEY